MVNKLKLLEKYSFLRTSSLSEMHPADTIGSLPPDLFERVDGEVRDIKSAEEKINNGYSISFGHEQHKGYLDLIKLVSMKLNELGFIHRITNIFNEDIKKSIIEFQEKNKLNITGQIDKELYLKVTKNVDIVVKKSPEEKKHDDSRTGQYYAVMDFDKKERELRDEYFYGNIDEEKEEEPSDEQPSDEQPEVPQGKFNVYTVSAESGVPAAMIMAFVKGESGGNSKAKAFNGDNFCSNLGWNESKVDEYHKKLIDENVSGKIDVGSGPWKLIGPREVLVKVESKKEYKDEYESKGMRYKELDEETGKGYAYYDVAYFNAHRKGDSQKAFDIAYAISPAAAVKATAWGKGQVLGGHLISEYSQITTLGSGKAARDFFDKRSEEASSKMYVSWVKRAGKFKNNKKNREHAEKYGVPEVIGASYIDVINMANENPDQIGYFAFLTRKYYGTFSNSYASKLQSNFYSMRKIYSNNRIAHRIKRLIRIRKGV